jgi:Tol biopolymer transport system component
VIVCRVCGHENPEGTTFCENCKSFLEFSGERVGGSDATGAGTTSGSPGTGSPGADSTGGGSTGGGSTGTGSTPPPPPPPPIGPRPPVPPPVTPPPASTSSDAAPLVAPIEPAPVRPGPAVRDTSPAAVPPGTPRTPVPPPIPVDPSGQVDAGMPRCPRCGTPNEPDRVFCKYCGQNLTSSAPPPVAPPRKGLTWSDPRVIAGIVGVIAILAIGGFALLGRGGTPAASPSPSASSAAVLPTLTPSPSATASPTLKPTVSPSPVPTATATAEPTATESAAPTATESAAPTATESAVPTATATATAAPTGGPSVSPSVAPTPTAIVFYAVANGQVDLFNIPPAGGNASQLTNEAAPDSDPKQSRDGTRVVFDSTRQDGQRNIWVMPADGSGTPSPLTSDTGAINRFATWSPDGKKIAWEHNGQIWTMNSSDGSDATQLTSGPTDSVPSWSKTNVIAFQRTTNGISQVFTVKSTGGTPTLIIDSTGGPAGQPSWSVDGKHIAYTRLEGGVRRVWVANADAKSGRKRITTGSECPCQFPSWSPDGKQLAIEIGPTNKERIAVVPSAGGTVTPLTDESIRAFTPGWGS